MVEFWKVRQCFPLFDFLNGLPKKRLPTPLKDVPKNHFENKVILAKVEDLVAVIEAVGFHTFQSIVPTQMPKKQVDSLM